MERVMNTHLYQRDLIEEKFDICAYNAYKKEYRDMIKSLGNRNLREERERKKYLVNYYPKAPILQFTVPFIDEDGQMKRLPDYVVEEIREAIGSINLYPDPLTMKVAGDNYVLSVTYNDEDKDYSTKIILQYTFNKNIRQFEGYFAKSIENERCLPDYEMTRDPDHERFIGATYRNKTSLKVNISCYYDYTLSLSDFPDKLENFLTNVSLREAVLRRVFPTKAHYCKYLINEMIVKGVSVFHDHMTLTPLNWVKLSRNESVYNLYAKYMLTCYRTNQSQPIVDNQLSDEDKIKAMEILIEKYPFFTIDDQSETNNCVLDLWMHYFNKDLTKEHAHEMNLSDSVFKNLTTYCSLDPVKYSKIFELFPIIAFDVMLEDYNRRYNILRNRDHREDDAILSPEDVIYFNRLESTLPARWRLYFSGGTIDDPDFESGQDIIEKMRDGIHPANAIERINYLDIKDEKHPISVFELMTIVAPPDDDLKILNPKQGCM